MLTSFRFRACDSSARIPSKSVLPLTRWRTDELLAVVFVAKSGRGGSRTGSDGPGVRRVTRGFTARFRGLRPRSRRSGPATDLLDSAPTTCSRRWLSLGDKRLAGKTAGAEGAGVELDKTFLLTRFARCASVRLICSIPSEPVLRLTRWRADELLAVVFVAKSGRGGSRTTRSL